MYLILLFKNMLTIEHQIDFGRKRQKVDDETPPRVNTFILKKILFSDSNIVWYKFII